jgi:hypothetical protein
MAVLSRLKAGRRALEAMLARPEDGWRPQCALDLPHEQRSCSACGAHRPVASHQLLWGSGMVPLPQQSSCPGVGELVQEGWTEAGGTPRYELSKRSSAPRRGLQC